MVFMSRKDLAIDGKKLTFMGRYIRKVDLQQGFQFELFIFGNSGYFSS